MADSSAPQPAPLPTAVWQWRWPDVAAMAGLIFALLLMGLPLVTLLWGPEPPANPDSLTELQLDVTLAFSLAATALQALAFGLGMGLVMLVRRVPPTAVGLRSMSAKWWGYSVGLGLLCIPLTAYAAYGFQLLFYDEIVNPQLNFVVPEGFSWVALGGMLLLIGFVIPVVEELFFRGVLFSWLRQKWPFWLAALVSSGVFALLHGELSLMVGTMLLGVLAAGAMEMSGSLWSAVVIHVLNNAVKVLALYVALL